MPIQTHRNDSNSYFRLRRRFLYFSLSFLSEAGKSVLDRFCNDTIKVINPLFATCYTNPKHKKRGREHSPVQEVLQRIPIKKPHFQAKNAVSGANGTFRLFFSRLHFGDWRAGKAL